MISAQYESCKKKYFKKVTIVIHSRPFQNRNIIEIMSPLFLLDDSESISEESYYSIEDDFMLHEVNYNKFSYANLLARANLLSTRIKDMLEEISEIHNAYHFENGFERDILRDDVEDQSIQKHDDWMENIFEHYSYILG